MSKKLIVFDKDGTLMDFDAFWVNVSIVAIKEVLKNVKMEEVDVDKFITVFGVKDGITDIDGMLCKGTYKQLGLAVYDILKEYGCANEPDEIVDMLKNAYKNNTNAGEVKPTCDNIRDVLSTLKNDGRKLAIVTTDNYEITYECLDKLGVRDLFDAVFADDGVIPTKPDPTCILEYCKTLGITAGDAVMVGDTMTDVRFARNAGMNVICVGTTEENRSKLVDYADAVVNDISYIPAEIKGLEQV